jgi:hypothetical protein
MKGQVIDPLRGEWDLAFRLLPAPLGEFGETILDFSSQRHSTSSASSAPNAELPLYLSRWSSVHRASRRTDLWPSAPTSNAVPVAHHVLRACRRPALPTPDAVWAVIRRLIRDAGLPPDVRHLG